MDNTQVSLVAIDLLDIGQARATRTRTRACAHYFLPNTHAGDLATTIKDLQRAGVNVYRLSPRPTIAGAHRFGNYDISAVQGGAVAGADRGDDAAGRGAPDPDPSRRSTGSRRCSGTTGTGRSTTSTTR